MFLCIMCHTSVELDDVAVSLSHGRVICLHCYARQTGSERRMPAALQRTISACLQDCATAL